MIVYKQPETIIHQFLKNKRPLNKMSGYFSEKRGLKNIYEKLCLKYTKILEAFNIQSMNNSKESINSSKEIEYIQTKLV